MASPGSHPISPTLMLMRPPVSQFLLPSPLSLRPPFGHPISPSSPAPMPRLLCDFGCFISASLLPLLYNSSSAPRLFCNSSYLFSATPAQRRVFFATPVASSSRQRVLYGVAIGSTFDEEPPLLEELGIDTRQIWHKTSFILNPFSINTAIHKEADLSSPFLFVTAFSLFQLLAEKLQFDIILGWLIVSSLFLYVIFNMLVGRNGNLDLYCCLSLVDYCMLPMVIFSSVSFLVSKGSSMVFSMAGVFVL